VLLGDGILDQVNLKQNTNRQIKKKKQTKNKQKTWEINCLKEKEVIFLSAVEEIRYIHHQPDPSPSRYAISFIKKNLFSSLFIVCV
jgi:hypothetical protein